MAEREKTQITLGELAGELGGTLAGDPGSVVRGANTLADAGADEIAFLVNSRYERFMADTAAAAVIVAADYAGPGQRLLRCQDPYFAFRQAMVRLYGFRPHPFAGVDESARVDPSARLGADVAIGPFVTVAAGAAVGDRSVLYPGAYVGSGCRIGADCVLYPNVVLYDGTVLGDRVTVHACSVIGQDGFGYATHDGRHEKIPQVGWVEVGDDVEIGAACTIDRATMGATAIGAGTKFSNLVAIGHGTRVGRACLFVAQSGVAGSTTIGDGCSLAGQAGVVGHITIGSGVRVGAKAGVINDVQGGQEVFGQPAIPRSQARRVYSLLHQLPEMREQIRKLTADVQALRRRGSADDETGR